MTTLRILIVVVLINFCACGQRDVKSKADSRAVKLNNRAMSIVPFMNFKDSCLKAISLLDSATAIDSTYFLGHFNKLIFLEQLKEYSKEAIVIDHLIKIKPFANDLYSLGGIIRERIGDTINSKKYFQKSLLICDKVLDTMNIKNRDYEMIVGNKAVNLIMLGEGNRGNEILQKLYNNQSDSLAKKMTLSIMNKTKWQLLDSYTNQIAP